MVIKRVKNDEKERKYKKILAIILPIRYIVKKFINQTGGVFYEAIL